MYGGASGHKITKGRSKIEEVVIPAGNKAWFYFVPDAGEVVRVTYAGSEIDTGTEAHRHVHWLYDGANWVQIAGEEAVTGLVRVETRNVIISSTGYLVLGIWNFGTVSYTGKFVACGEVIE